MPKVDISAKGSDIPRSRRQYLARRFGAVVVAALGLNRPGFLSTEIVQQINPIFTIPTQFGTMRCKGGHGRLRWRALTFHTEEPDTIKWLDSMNEDSVLWDVGANVGLYSIYAAKAAGCKVLAIEPEAQNYALLLENIALNGVQANVTATNLAITKEFGLGTLMVNELTKGGAYNQFSLGLNSQILGRGEPLANADSGTQIGTSMDEIMIRLLGRSEPSPDAVSQMQIGVSLDELLLRFQCAPPTHIKVDVDGIEPEIISGASQVLSHDRCVSLLIEVERDDPRTPPMLERISTLGFRCVSERTAGEAHTDQVKNSAADIANMIYNKETDFCGSPLQRVGRRADIQSC